MEFSSEVKEWLTLLLMSGIGIGCLGYFILVATLYFRLTRKYDAMFPEYDRIVPFPLIMGTVIRTSLYAYLIIFKNLIKRKHHRITYEVTNGYDFRGNASRLDIVLSYSYMFFVFLFVGSLLIFILLTEVFGIDL